MIVTELNNLRKKEELRLSKRAEYARQRYQQMKEDPTFVQYNNTRIRAWQKQKKLQDSQVKFSGPKKRIGRPPVEPKEKPDPKQRGRPLKTYTYLQTEN